MKIGKKQMKKATLIILLLCGSINLFGMRQQSFISPEQSAFNKKLRYAGAATGALAGFGNLCYQASKGNLSWQQFGLSCAAIGAGISWLSKKDLGMSMPNNSKVIPLAATETLAMPKSAVPHASKINKSITQDQIIALPNDDWEQLYYMAQNHEPIITNTKIWNDIRHDVREEYLQNHEYSLWQYTWSWLKAKWQNKQSYHKKLLIKPTPILNTISVNKPDMIEKFIKQEQRALPREIQTMYALWKTQRDQTAKTLNKLPAELIRHIASYISTNTQLQRLGLSTQEIIDIIFHTDDDADRSNITQKLKLITVKDLVSLLSYLDENEISLTIGLQQYRDVDEETKKTLPYYKRIIGDILNVNKALNYGFMCGQPGLYQSILALMAPGSENSTTAATHAHNSLQCLGIIQAQFHV